MSRNRFYKRIRSAYLVGLITFAVGVLTASGQMSANADPVGVGHFDSLLADGQHLFESGCYTYAENLFQEALEEQPNSIAASAGLEKAKQAEAHEQGLTPQAQADNIQLSQKCDKIILPQVFFDHTRLTYAVEYLWREGIRLDTAPDSDHQGVKIIVQSPTVLPDSDNEAMVSGLTEKKQAALAATDPAVTLELHNVPFLHAIRYLGARAGGRTVELHDGAIYLVECDYHSKQVITKQFHITPQILSAWAKRISTNELVLSPEDMIQFLKAEGVTFPTGTDVTYLPTTGELAVHNTQDNVDLIESNIFAAIHYKDIASPTTP